MAQSSGNASDADFFGGQTGSTGSNVRPVAPRPTDPTGLFYLDTGEPTPMYFQRQRLLSGGLSAAQREEIERSDARKTWAPVTQAEKQQWKIDPRTGLFVQDFGNGDRVSISNDPAARDQNRYNPTPTFTVSQGQDGNLTNGTGTLIGGAQGALGGGLAGGPAGALVGGVAGALGNLPGASGRPLVLGASDSGQVQFGNTTVTQQGITPQQAAQANANLAATGRSGNPAYPGFGTGGGAGGYQPMPLPNMATYTPGMGTSGNSALSQEAQRILNQANQFSTQNVAAADRAGQAAAAAGQRAAPQMALPSSANSQAVYDRAMNFQADTSGAQRLENMQFDMQGINNLESWSPQYSMQGVNNLESFSPTNSQQGVNNLLNFRPTYAEAAFAGLENFNAGETLRSAADLRNFTPQDTRTAAAGLNQFDSYEGRQAANALKAYKPSYANSVALQLQNFESDRSGIDRLNAYADAPEGPSQAQALLRSQSDQDKRTALALARSGRGGPAAQALAQRQAITEGAAISAETRGQGAALRAAETDAYKSRQLQALAQAGSMISAAEAQRLTALANAGQIRTNQDAQALAALQAFAQVQTTMDSQRLSAQQASGQLYASADNMRLGALQGAGQLSSNADSMRLSGMQTAGQMRTAADSQMLGATSNAAQLQGQMDSQILNARTNAAQLRSTMDAQGLSAISTAAGLRGQNDQIRSSNLQAAGNIRLQGSAQQLGALSLAGQVASDIRNQDINVLRSNLDAQLQTMGLNDNQVRFFSQMQNDRELANQTMQQNAASLGLNAQQIQNAQNALDLQWQQFGFSQLTSQQQLQYQYDVLNSGNNQFAQQQAFQAQQAAAARQQQQQQQMMGLFGTGLTALSSLFSGSGSNAGGLIAPVMGLGSGTATNMAGQPTGTNANGGTQSGYNSMGMVYDPFTGQWVYPSAA